MMEKDPPVLRHSSTEAGELRRGRHYRLEAGDGFYEILDVRSGEQVAVFSDGAFGAAWNRFVELEYDRSISGVVTRGWRTALHRWDAAIGAAVALIAVAILVLAASGGIEPLRFLSSGDPEPAPAVDLGLLPTEPHPDATSATGGNDPREKDGNDGGGGQNRRNQGERGRRLVAGGPDGSGGGKQGTSSTTSNNETSNGDPKPSPNPDPGPDPGPNPSPSPDPTIEPTTTPTPTTVSPPPDDDEEPPIP